MLGKIWDFFESLGKSIVFFFAGIFKIDITQEQWDSFAQFVKFAFVGLSNTLITYVSYVICVYFGIYYQLSNLIGYLIGIVNSFYWNNKYVFKQKEGENRSIVKAFVKCVMSYAGGYVISTVLLFLWVQVFHLSEYLAPIISLLLTVPLNFVLNKKWAFKAENEEELDLR